MFSAFLVLLTLKVVLCSTEGECEENGIRVCYENVGPYEVPENEEELNNLCGIEERSMECAVHYLERCPHQDDGRKRRMQNVQKVMSTVCQQDSLLHAAISENLKCIKPTIENTEKICGAEDSVKATSIMNRYSTQMAMRGISAAALNETDAERCMFVQYQMACIVAHAGESCNAIAKDALTELFLEVMTALSPCLPEFINDLRAFVNIYEAAESERNGFNIFKVNRI